MYIRNYSFRMNIMEEITEIRRSYIETLTNDVKIDTTDQYVLKLIENYQVYILGSIIL